MIKKTLLGLGLTTICLIGFTNAKVQDVGLLKYPSTVDQNFSIGFIKGGGVLTDFLGSTKSVVALDTNTIFWRANNGMPYFYSEGVNTIQGFFDRYFSCDALTTIDTLPENCQLGGIIDYSGDLQPIKDIFKGFFSKVKQDDLAYYNYINNRYVGATLSYTEQGLEICWSSEEIGKSLCFRGGTCGASHSSHCNGFLGGGQLTNSQNLSNLSFGNVANSRIGYAPGQAGYDGNRNNTNDNTTNIVIGSCPTIAQILQNNYGSSYNTGLCYNNTTYFNGTNFEQVEKEDIYTIFDDNYETYTNRISTYRNNCNNYVNTQQACANAFSGEYKKYSIISNAMNSNVEVKKLWNYCNLALNYDPNATTCVASGVIKEKPTQEEMLDAILNINAGVPTPGNATGNETNNVFNSLCDPNNPNECYGTGNVRDIFGSMQRIYGKITGLFTQREGVKGIIPDYILRITFLILLFTIIFKK